MDKEFVFHDWYDIDLVWRYLEEIGLPSFEEFLATTTSLFSRVGNLQDCKEYLESMSNFLDDTGKVTSWTFSI